MSLPTPTPDTPVVVTGASSGIGLEIARALARRKYPLILVARRDDRLHALAEDLVASHGVTVDVLPLDLAAADERARLVERLSHDERRRTMQQRWVRHQRHIHCPSTANANRSPSTP